MSSKPDKLQSAAELLRDTGVCLAHCRQVAGLSGWLFEQTASLHGFGEAERVLLLAGALLHDVGVSVTYQRHHKNSRDMILAADLPGFDSRERRIVASIARYHRKALPSLNHRLFAGLSSGDRETVRKLAAIVRIADGLDRSHTSAVTELRACCVDAGVWEIVVWGRGDLSSELWAAREKKRDLFEEAYGVELRIVAGR